MQKIITGQVAVSPVTNRKSAGRKSVARKLPHYVLSALLLTGFAGAATPAFAAPAAPTNIDMTNGTDNGLFFNDNITSNQQPQFTGKGTPLSVVRLYTGTTEIGIGVTNPSGQWFVGTNVKLANGTHNITAKQTVAGGAVSAASAPLKVVIDTIAPTTSNADLAAGSDTGLSSTDDVTSITKPVLQGTGTPGAYITLFLMGSGKTVGNAIVGADGRWVTNGLFSPGNEISYVILSKATDLAGNVKQAGGALNILIDTVAPSQAQAPDLVASSDSGVSNTDNKTNVMQPTFTVKSEPYSIVKLTAISYDTPVVGTATANASGIATITPTKPFTNGYYNMVAKSYDRAGNTTFGSSPELLVLTTLAPPTKASKPMLDSASDSGKYNDTITNVTVPTVRGMGAEPNKTITINFFAGIFQYNTSTTTDKFGNWTAKAPKPLPDGIYDVKVITTDDLGNSSESDALQVTIDTTPPAAPPAPDLAFYNDYGVSESDNITSSNESNNSYFEFYGKNTPDADYKLFNNGVLLKSGSVQNNGEWVANVKLNPGIFNLTFSINDVAGNFSKPSPVLTGLVDGTVPSCDMTSQPSGFAKDLTSLAGTAMDPVENYSGVRNVAVKVLKLNGGMFWNGTAWTTDFDAAWLPTDYANGKWSKTTGLPTAAQTPDGPYVVLVYVYDNAGNGALEKEYNVTVENGAPTVSFTTPAAGAVIKNLGTVSGTATDAISGIAKVELNLKRNSDGKYWDGNAWVTGAVALKTILSGNTWTRLAGWPTAANFPNGAYTFTARAEDNAGNFATTNRSITANANGASSIKASSLHETQLSNATGSAAQNTLTLTFDGPLDPQTTEEVAGYVVKIGNYEAFISDVQFKGSNTVVLTFVEDVIHAGDLVNVSYDLLDADGKTVIGQTAIAINGQATVKGSGNPSVYAS